MRKIENITSEITGRYKTSDPDELCEKMGIVVHDHDLPQQINGFASSIDGVPFIVLNSALGYYQRRITLAHELGHIVLHRYTNSVSLSANTSFCTSKYEREADKFAACLLLSCEIDDIMSMERVTAEDVSMLTHMPVSMVEKAFFDS